MVPLGSPPLSQVAGAETGASQTELEAVEASVPSEASPCSADPNVSTFVPLVVEEDCPAEGRTPFVPPPSLAPAGTSPTVASDRIEIEVAGVVVRPHGDIAPDRLAAVVVALRRSSGLDGSIGKPA